MRARVYVARSHLSETALDGLVQEHRERESGAEKRVRREFDAATESAEV